MAQPNILSCLLLAGAGLFSLTSSPSSARADGVSVRVSAAGRARAGVHVNVGEAVGSFVLDGGIALGVRFAEPPPPPPPPPVPSYYVTETVYVESPPEVIAYEPPPRMRRWGLGAFAGSFDVSEQEAGSDLGVLARYRLSRAFSLEGELSKSSFQDGARVDKRAGAALLYNLAPRRTLSPFLLAGAGFGQAEIGGGEFHAEQAYGELGGGLQYRISRSLHLVGDIRFGARNSGEQDVAYMSTAPVAEFEEDESYTRARLAGLFFF